jgi:hypothetical protein
MFSSQASIDAIRSLGFASIGATYTAIGAPTEYQTRIICFTNTTDADVLFSVNGLIDQLIAPAGFFKLFDVTTNHRPVNMDDFVIKANTQWFVKYASAAPTSGAVYIEIIYAQPT